MRIRTIDKRVKLLSDCGLPPFERGQEVILTLGSGTASDSKTATVERVDLVTCLMTVTGCNITFDAMDGTQSPRPNGFGTPRENYAGVMARS